MSERSDFGNAELSEVIVGVVIENWCASWIRLVTMRDKDDHPLPRASQQNPVRVQQVSLPVFLVDRRLCIPSEGVVTPGLSVSA